MPFELGAGSLWHQSTLNLSPGILVSFSNYPISDFSFGTEIIG
jgi:hypothetical protein